ncbi:hypothetical protein J6590_099056 [Homalodisca vitripennis]|nr:hypothetical protein J6590_072907 [Homalodisca vitripennis]KAG8308879.1 hypothetical protein J6590_099056 [Homalodisca vitripennis]
MLAACIGHVVLVLAVSLRSGPTYPNRARYVSRAGSARLPFEKASSVNNPSTPRRQRNGRSIYKVAAVCLSVQRKPGLVNSSPSTRTRPFTNFYLANFASGFIPAVVQNSD